MPVSNTRKYWLKGWLIIQGLLFVILEVPLRSVVDLTTLSSYFIPVFELSFLSFPFLFDIQQLNLNVYDLDMSKESYLRHNYIFLVWSEMSQYLMYRKIGKRQTLTVYWTWKVGPFGIKVSDWLFKILIKNHAYEKNILNFLSITNLNESWWLKFEHQWRKWELIALIITNYNQIREEKLFLWRNSKNLTIHLNKTIINIF